MYKVTKCKPWVKDLRKHCDAMEKEDWTLSATPQIPQHQVLHSFDIRNNFLFIFINDLFFRQITNI